MDVDVAMEEVMSRVVGRQEGQEDTEQAAGALSGLRLVLVDSRVLVTVGTSGSAGSSGT